MKILLTLLTVLMLLGIAYPVQAQNSSVTLSWDAPTTNQDLCNFATTHIDPCVMTQALCEANGGTFIPGGVIAPPVDYYNVYSGTATGNYDTITNAGNVLTYKIDALTDDTQYFFSITAHNGINESCKSPEFTLTTKPTPTPSCSPPSNIRGVVN